MPAALSFEARKVLKYLVDSLPQIDPEHPQSFPSYGRVLDVLKLDKNLGNTYGVALDRQGLAEAAKWTASQSVPAITGLIIDSSKLTPGPGFFNLYGKDELADSGWWLEQIRAAKAYEWSTVLRDAGIAVGTVDPKASLRTATKLGELTKQDSRFYLKSEWGPVSDVWPALSFGKRTTGEYLNSVFRPDRDFVLYAGTGNPENTRVAEYRKKLLSVLVPEPGALVPTEDLVPWESWQKQLQEKDKIWPYSLPVRAAWDCVGLPAARDIVPEAYAALGVQRNWGGVVEISGSEALRIRELSIRWRELPKRDVADKAAQERDRLRRWRDTPELNQAVTRMSDLIRQRLGPPGRTQRVELPFRSIPPGLNLHSVIAAKLEEQKELCALCNKKVELGTAKKLLQCSPDRIDSGNPSYGSDNLQITHLACNLAKNNASNKDFEEWLQLICGV